MNEIFKPIPLTQEQIDEMVWRLLLIGDPGAGKTLAYSHWPKPMLVNDFDGKFEDVFEFFPELKKALDNGDIKLKTYGYKKFPNFRKDWEALSDYREYRTIVLDSLTFLSKAIMNYMLPLRGTEGGKSVGVIPIPDWDEYKGEASGLSTIMSQLVELSDNGVNVILTAHLVQSLDLQGTGKKITGSRMKRSLLTGGAKIAQEIPGVFKDMWYITSDTTGINLGDPRQYYAVTQPTEYDMARTAKRLLPAKIDYTYPKNLYEEVCKHLRGETVE